MPQRKTQYCIPLKKNLENCLKKQEKQQNNDLHLSVSIRSFRSEKVSSFVEKIINLDVTNAQNLLKELEQGKI